MNNRGATLLYLSCRIGKRSGEAVFLDADDVKLIRRFANESPAAMTELLTTDEVRAIVPLHSYRH